MSVTAETLVAPARRAWLPLAAALVTVCLWASAFVGIRAAGQAYSPGALALGRLLLGTLFLGALMLTRPFVRPSRRDIGLLLVAGLLWFGLYNLVLNQAERLVDAGTAAMVVNVGPILIVGLAALVLNEKLSRSLLLGGVVAFAGVLVIGLATTTGDASLAGVLLCLVAAIAYSIGVVAQKPVLSRLPALQVTWMCCAIGAVAGLGYAPTLIREVAAAPIGATSWLFYLGAFPTSLAFTLWAYALARGTASRLAATTYLVAPITVLMSWLVLQETPSLLAVAGGAVSLVGVGIARRT